MTRTKNAVRNTIWGVANKLVMTIMPFIARSFLIYYLGMDYVGLSSVFTSVLQVLSLAELGFSSAIVYCMYKPIANGEESTICALLNLFKKIYRIVGGAIFVIGLAMTPLLGFVIDIKQVPSGMNMYWVYLLFLFNTAISYFLFAYKNSLLTAYQRNDVISNIATVIKIGQTVCEILILLFFRNYYLYIAASIIFTIVLNILTAYYSNKMFPHIKCEGEVDIDTKQRIKKQTIGLLFARITGVTRNSIDSICISAFIGLTIAGIYNNYFMVFSGVAGLIDIFVASMQAGVGDSIANDSMEKNYTNLYTFNFIYMWIVGFACVCMFCLYQPFMKLWLGESALLPFYMVALFCLYFMLTNAGNVLWIYYSGAGLWWYGKWAFITEGILNVVLNIVLGYFFGLPGIIIATCISILLIGNLWNCNTVFKHYFKSFSLSKYFLSQGMYILVTAGTCIVAYYICDLVTRHYSVTGIFELVVRLFICLFVANAMFFLLYFKTKICKQTYNWVMGKIREYHTDKQQLS